MSSKYMVSWSDLSDYLFRFYPMLWFAATTSFFYFAIQLPVGKTRRALSILHIFSVTTCLLRLGLAPFCHLLIPSAIVITMHTTSILFMEKYTINAGPAFSVQRLRAVFRTWSNVRRLPLSEDDTGCRGRSTAFAMFRCSRILALFIINRLVTHFASHAMLRLNIRVWDFGPAKQGLLPHMIQRDLCLRGIMSVCWIWTTYSTLTIAHDLLAVFFVSLLRWDQPGEWPRLFGNLADAYSLRRFWGVFWHRLHLEPFGVYMPPCLIDETSGDRQQPPTPQQRPRAGLPFVRKTLRALAMFTLSAICHATVNWLSMGRSNAAQELRFFLANFAMCWTETVYEINTRGSPFSGRSVWVRLLGYVWVLAVFFTLAPAWQYSLLYTARGF